MKNDSVAVRIAALTTLGELGDAASVPLLAEVAANRDGTEQAAARGSLYRLRGADVDKAIGDAIAAVEPKTRLELIRAAGERGTAAAVPVLLKMA